MAQIVGVRFNRAGRVYYFHASGLGLSVNDDVVVQTSLGLELGKVIVTPNQVIIEQFNEPLKPVLRRAHDGDFAYVKSLASKEKEAMIKCQELINSSNCR